MKRRLIQGFSKSETNRIQTHLERLLPYLVLDRFVVVGGLAIRYLLTQSGIVYPKREFNDLDIIAENSRVVLPSVANEFFIYHYHPQKGKSFYIVLVDPISKTKIDIFDYTMPPKEVIRVPFNKYLLKIQSAEDQLIKTVLDLQRISPDAKVDPKQFSDAALLMQIVDINKAETFWREKRFTQYPGSLMSALKKAETITKEHPEYLQEKPFRKSRPYICPDCINIADFPLTPMEKIYKILGYVE